MKRSLLQLVLWMIVLVPARVALAEDVVHLKDGSKKRGTVTGTEGNAAILGQATQYGEVRATVPLADIERVEFDETPAIRDFLSRERTMTPRQALALWNQQAPFVAVPGSLAGEVALALGRKANETKEPGMISAARAALTVAREKSWEENIRIAAFDLGLQILLAAGETDAVRQEAEEGLKSEDPARRIASSHVMALALIDEYKALITENPRWEIDPLVRPERDRIYHRIFDLLLVPYLDYGLPETTAARSVWEMVRFYDFNGEHAAAAEAAKDITTVYPKTIHAKSAGEYLAKTQNK